MTLKKVYYIGNGIFFEQNLVTGFTNRFMRDYIKFTTHNFYRSDNNGTTDLW